MTNKSLSFREFTEYIGRHRISGRSVKLVLPETRFLHDLHAGADDMVELFCDVEAEFGVKIYLERFNFGTFFPKEPARVVPPRLFGKATFAKKMEEDFPKFTVSDLYSLILPN